MTAMSHAERLRRQRDRDRAYSQGGGIRLTLKISRAADDALTLLAQHQRMTRRAIVEGLLLGTLQLDEQALSVARAGLSAQEAQFLLEQGARL